ncbi:hypothetical protein ACSBR1_041409 [Camellia fascicularis]
MATTRRTPQQGTQANLFGQINVAFLSMTHYYFSQGLHSSASCHAILAFILPLLLSFLQLKYQGNKNRSPFDTHPKSVGVSIASLLLYCFVYDAELRSSENHRHQTYAFIARRGMVCFGWLAVVSLASILLPDSLGLPLYFLYILFLAGELLRRHLQMLWNWVHQIIVSRVPLMLPSRLTAHSFSNTGGTPRLQKYVIDDGEQGQCLKQLDQFYETPLEDAFRVIGRIEGIDSERIVSEGIDSEGIK